MLYFAGIYSDTHLLALMYGGEMCYWLAKSTAEPAELDKSIISVGRDMLKTYVDSIEQLPELQAVWNTDRAKQLLTELKSR